MLPDHPQYLHYHSTFFFSGEPAKVLITRNFSHTESHHKLIRRRFVTNSGINRYSQMIIYMYLKCSTNNRASIAWYNCMVHFWKESDGTVRTDQGRETTFVLLSTWLNTVTITGKVSSLAAQFTINRSNMCGEICIVVWQCYSISSYYLEHIGLLDPMNEMHVYTLHYVLFLDWEKYRNNSMRHRTATQ